MFELILELKLSRISDDIKKELKLKHAILFDDLGGDRPVRKGAAVQPKSFALQLLVNEKQF